MQSLVARATAGAKSHGHEGHGEHEPVVSPVELFSDLVFVVALNITARLLEESTDFWKSLWLYSLRIYLLWQLHNYFMGISNHIHTFSGAFRTHHYVGMLLFMGSVLFCVRAFEASEHRLGFYCYIFARLVGQALHLSEVSKPRPPAMSETLYAFHKQLAFVITPIVVPVIDLGWIGAAAYYVEPGAAVVSTLALLLWSAPLAWTVLLKHVVPALCMPDASEPPFRPHHFAERYELIMLIFIGEIAFAVAAPGSLEVSACAFVVMCCTFLLHFACVPNGRTSAFALTIQHLAAEEHRHILLFCALGGLGGGYTLAAHEAAPHDSHGGGGHHRRLAALEAHGVEEASLAAGSHGSLGVLGVHGSGGHGSGVPGLLECATNAHYMLALSSATFLLVSAWGLLLNPDPTEPPLRPRLGGGARCAVRSAAGLATGALMLLPTCEPFPTAAAVPALMLIPTLIELWGCQPRASAEKGYAELS